MWRRNAVCIPRPTQPLSCRAVCNLQCKHSLSPRVAGRWRGRLVAIKVLRAAFPGDAAAELDSFRREVRVLSSLQHDRIVGLLGAWLLKCPLVLILMLQAHMPSC